MEATKVFKKLLNEIESSQLNYVINKTPFTATIVLKSSFIKYFNQPTTSGEYIAVKTEPENKLENDDFNKKLVNIKKEKETLESMLQSERHNVKALENEIGGFREELLIVKKEKHELEAQLKRQKKKASEIKEEQTRLCEVNKDLERQIVYKTEKLDAKNEECKVLQDINSSVRTELDQCVQKVNLMKLESQVEKKVDFKCNYCDMIFECKVQLSEHVRADHIKHQVSQTRMKKVENFTQTEEIFENYDLEYPCFYCNQGMTTNNLETHQSECCELGSVVYEDEVSQSVLLPASTIFPCDQCNSEFSDRGELQNHYTTTHPERLLYWCDFCGSKCENLIDLQYHIRSVHRNLLP